MATLWIYGERQTKSIALDESVVTIGRTASNLVRVQDATISKHHARLTRNHDGWWLEDLGSANGTWIGSRRVTDAERLDVGTRFKLGKHEFLVDEIVVRKDSLQELQQRGTIVTSMQAIPSGLLQSSSATLPMLDNTANRTTPLTEKTTRHSASKAPLDSSDPIKNVTTASTSADAAASGAESSERPQAQSDLSSATAVREENSEERKLRLIRAVGEAIINTTEIGSVANDILGILVDELHADRAFVCLYEESGAHGPPVASAGVQPGEEIVFSQTVQDEMRSKRAGVLIQQVGNDQSVTASLVAAHIESTMCVPLWTKDRIMGFVSMDITSTTRSFTKSDLEILISVSHQAAIGIERARLSELALQERKRRDYLSQYLDHKIIQSVLDSSQEIDPLEPREQTITVLFCDIVAFTQLSEGLPPGELAAMIHDHFTAMTEILFAHNGTIDKYIGDSVMALFGAPVADERAPEYAVQAALAMQQNVNAADKPNFKVRFGIATGPAVVGNIGSSQRREYTAIGDTVNVASRLEQLGESDHILVDQATADRLGDQFQLTPMGDIEIRNRSEAMKVFRVERNSR